MPIFSFVCDDCAEKFELLVGMTENVKLQCAQCGSTNISKVFGSSLNNTTRYTFRGQKIDNAKLNF
jgi:putative FmdB family regulatory protein